MTKNSVKRRTFIKGGLATGSLMLGGGLAMPALASYPDRNIDVIIPTREGGGADRLFRAFTSLWKNHMNTNFEPGFFQELLDVLATKFTWVNINLMPIA